jgi:hypothetical protein
MQRLPQTILLKKRLWHPWSLVSQVLQTLKSGYHHALENHHDVDLQSALESRQAGWSMMTHPMKLQRLSTSRRHH